MASKAPGAGPVATGHTSRASERTESGTCEGDAPIRERWAVAQFVVSGLAAVALIVVLVLVAFARAGREEAAASATEVARVTAATVIAPLVDERVLAGDRAALARLYSQLRLGALHEPVLRVTIYRRTARSCTPATPTTGRPASPRTCARRCAG